MTSRIAKGILVCALVLAARAASAEDAGSRGLDASWKKAMLSGDIEAIAANYADDAVLWLPNRNRHDSRAFQPRFGRSKAMKSCPPI